MPGVQSSAKSKNNQIRDSDTDVTLHRFEQVIFYSKSQPPATTESSPYDRNRLVIRCPSRAVPILTGTRLAASLTPLVVPAAALIGRNLSRLAALAAAGSGGLPVGFPAAERGSLSWRGAAFPATVADLPRPPGRQRSVKGESVAEANYSGHHDRGDLAVNAIWVIGLNQM